MYNIEDIYRIVFYIIGSLLSAYYYCLRLELLYRKLGTYIIISILIITTYLPLEIIRNFIAIEYVDIIGNILQILLELVIVILFTKGKLKKKIVTYVEINIINAIAVIVGYITSSVSNNKIDYKMYITTIIIMLILLILISLYTKYKKPSKKGENQKLIILLSCALLIMLYMLGMTIKDNNNKVYILALCICIMVFVLILYIIYYIDYRIYNYEITQRKLRILKEQRNNDLIFYKEIQKNEEEIIKQKKLLYDRLLEISKIPDEDVKEKSTVSRYCKNDIINAIITEKYKIAIKNNIETSINIDCNENIAISPNDMVVVLGNLLDNAIEAALHIENFKDRWIHVNIDEKDCKLHIKIENSYDGIVKMDKGIIQTRKEDKEMHGIGVKSIERIVNGYEMKMCINSVNNIFCVEIF